MRKRDIKGQVTPQGGSAYSQAVEMTDVTCILHASGQVGTDVDGTVPPDMAAQAHLAWRNLRMKLAGTNMGVSTIW